MPLAATQRSQFEPGYWWMLRWNTRRFVHNPRKNQLGRSDSNQDIRIQSPLCYRCTTPQFLSGHNTERPFKRPELYHKGAMCGNTWQVRRYGFFKKGNLR
jgi:hypothetical protein